MSVMEQNRRNRIRLGQDNNALTWLVMINMVVFVLVNFIKIIYFLSYDSNAIANDFFHKQIVDWFTLPGNLEVLASRPWTIVVYMFTHESVWHLISSMLWLWGFGYILQDLTGNNKLIPVYLYGGLAGAIFYLLTTNLFPALSSATMFIGAGSSIMAIAVATTTLAPDYRIFPMINGGIPLWVLTLIYVAIDFATVASSSGSYALAHLAGGAIGFIFIRQLRRGHDWGGWMIRLLNWLDDLFNPEKKHAKPSQKQTHFYKTHKKPFEKTPHITQQKLDEILDKINQKGYHFLTDEEKDFLKKASQEDI